MNICRLKSSALLMWLLSSLTVLGCRPMVTAPVSLSMKQLPPGEFYADPVQVRLATAIDAGDAAAVADAVRAGADIRAWGKGGYSLLYWAMARGNVAGFEAILKNGGDVTGEYRDPRTLQQNLDRATNISLAFEVPDPGFLKAALRQGLDPDYVLDKGSSESLLFLAGRHHNEAAIQLLLDSGANIEHQNHLGYTALGEAGLRCDFKTMCLLMDRGASPLTGRDQCADVAYQLKTYGSRGVQPDHRESFEKIVAELVRRGLLTRQDIVEADKPKQQSSFDGPPGITVIEHAPDSEAAQAIRELDQLERDANARDRVERGR
jgi:hypothetical protein